jgi:hypothetical protein
MKPYLPFGYSKIHQIIEFAPPFVKGNNSIPEDENQSKLERNKNLTNQEKSYKNSMLEK